MEKAYEYRCPNSLAELKRVSNLESWRDGRPEPLGMNNVTFESLPGRSARMVFCLIQSVTSLGQKWSGSITKSEDSSTTIITRAVLNVIGRIAAPITSVTLHQGIGSKPETGRVNYQSFVQCPCQVHPAGASSKQSNNETGVNEINSILEKIIEISPPNKWTLKVTSNASITDWYCSAVLKHLPQPFYRLETG